MSASEFRAASRLKEIGVSEILAIGARAAALKRAGHPVIVLGAGEPDFDTPRHVKHAAIRAIEAGQTKYTALDGTLELKQAIVEKLKRENGVSYEPAEITVGAGAKQVLHNAFMATLDQGDEVILVAPYWTSYADMVLLADGIPVTVAGRPEDGFRLHADDLRAAITPKTRWLLLNSPSNPAGATYSAEQLRPLIEVLKDHPHVWLMSDDIYEHLLYDGESFVSPAGLAPELKERSLIVNGVSKAYAMTGWRLGYGAGPKPLIHAISVVQSQSTSNPSSISQAAAIEALNGPQEVLEQRRAAFEARRDLVLQRLAGIPGLACSKPGGAFYLYIDCRGLIGRRAPDGTLIASDRDLSNYLLQQHYLALVPGACFGVSPYLRLSYAASETDLVEACDRLATACGALQ